MGCQKQLSIVIYTNGSKSSKQNQKTKTKNKKEVQSQKAAYKYEAQLNLDKLKKQGITKVKVDLTKMNIKH